jgi:single-stranded DNA-binding protein
MNTVTITGRFVRKPGVSKLAATGVAVSKATLIVKRGVELLCVAFGSTAQIMATVEANQSVTVSGSLGSIFTTSTDGNTQQRLELVVRSIGFGEDVDATAAVAALEQQKVRATLGSGGAA